MKTNLKTFPKSTEYKSKQFYEEAITLWLVAFTKELQQQLEKLKNEYGKTPERERIANLDVRLKIKEILGQ